MIVLIIYFMAVSTEALTNDSVLFHFNPIATILENCFVKKNILSPSEYDGHPTNATIMLGIDKVIGIDDVLETFTITGYMIIFWEVPCLKSLYSSSEWPKEKHLIDNLDESESKAFWTPTVYHRNYVYDEFFGKSTYSLGIDMTEGQFLKLSMGRIESQCNLDFTLFPFDRQTCSIEIMSLALIAHINFTNLSYAFTSLSSASSTTTPLNSNWKLVHVSTKIELLPHSVLVMKYLVDLERHPDYFLTTVFAPAMILSILETSSFFMPPETPDRATFAATVMLSLFVLQSQTMAFLPKTPKPIIATYYILGITTLAMLITIYAVAINHVYHHYPVMLKMSIRSIRLPLLIDNIVFAMTALLIVLVNSYILCYLGTS